MSTRNDSGCPCSNDCCEASSDTQKFCPDHDCPDDGEFCEDCYVCECPECGASCACAL